MAQWGWIIHWIQYHCIQGQEGCFWLLVLSCRHALHVEVDRLDVCFNHEALKLIFPCSHALHAEAAHSASVMAAAAVAAAAEKVKAPWPPKVNV